jgi:hyperosmotically inducible protein
MMTKQLSKTLMAASLFVALGAVGVAPAMATGAAMQSNTDTSMSTKVSDTWITTKVKADFATTKGVDVTDVSVDTKDGVVMLSGTVDSNAEKLMAIKSARSIKGVTAVQADKLMVDTNRDPMKSNPMNHGSMKPDSMSSDHGGSMATQTSLATKTSDTWITTKVKADYATTKGVDVTDVSVDTRDGVVTLSGTVDSKAEKRMAIKSARSVKGVKSVHAQKLMVGKNGASMSANSMNHEAMTSDTNDSMSSDTSLATKTSDTWITTKVKADYAITKGVDVTDVSVDTKAGVVMLSGTVDSNAEKQMAIKSARSVKGVKAVQADKLMVGKRGDSMSSDAMKHMNHDSMSSDTSHSMSSDTSLATKTSDTWITTKVKAEFATTKGVDVTDVSVDTKAGVVMLSGTVGSEAEKQMAIKSAKSVKGVKAVEAGDLTVGNDKM